MKVENRRAYRANRARGLLHAYRGSDRTYGRECTLTEQQLVAIIERPCLYCGTSDSARGADRIDNSRGHTPENCVPACRTCNMVRNDLFSVEEMKLLGQTIAAIHWARI